MTTSGLHLENVQVSLQGRRLLGPLMLTINPGQVVTLMGESGCGKSSLLAYLCGVLETGAVTASGKVLADGIDVTHLPPEARRIGILFQDDLLFPHMSVGENLAFALPHDIKGGAARRAAIENALQEAELPGFADRDPRSLSGGQRARVSVMRALLARPRALLLDEPFSRLDMALRSRFRAFVFDRVRRENLPTLLVTHDVEDARAAQGPVIELTLSSVAP